MKTIKNLTPHNITVQGNGLPKTFEPSGYIARVSSKYTLVDYINDLPVYETSFGQVEGLPDEEKGVLYIVSGMVLSAASERKDLLAPGELVRDIDGSPIGCNGLRRNTH